MTPEAHDFLSKARGFVRKSQDMLEYWPDEAGRAAYLAAFHAAQAFLFEKSGSVAKTHSGVRGQFGQMTKDDPRFDDELRAFLGRAYNLKTVADYETGPGAEIPPERAERAMRIATRFVGVVASAL